MNAKQQRQVEDGFDELIGAIAEDLEFKTVEEAEEAIALLKAKLNEVNPTDLLMNNDED